MNEKNNFGLNNDLPKMGSVLSDNIVSNNNTVDKFNLPPISSFTNFDNNNFNNNSLNDNNVSVFDLMDEFDNVNNMSRDQAFIKEPAQNNIQQTLANVHNGYNENQESFNVYTNSIPVSEPLNNSVMGNQVPGVIPVSENINVVESLNNPIMYNQGSSTPSEPININSVAPNVTDPIFNIEPGLTMENVNTNSAVEEINSPITFNPLLEETLGSVNNNKALEPTNEPLSFNQTPSMQNEPINTIQVSDKLTDPITFNPVLEETLDSVNNNKVVEPTNEPLSFNQGSTVNLNESTNEIVNNQINNNIPINEQQINSIADDVLKQATLNSQLNNNQPVDVLKNTKKELKEDQKKEKKPRKKHKLLLIIILIISFLIIIGSIVLSYFMFFKEDKLVCEYQDYASEDFLLSEVMTINFKGRQMTDAKFVERLNFTESGLLKKESYQVNLQNQFDGLGFNVSYYEMEDGFEITMDFTKENLESWTGAEIKNATKENLLREMKNSGYTCK